MCTSIYQANGKWDRGLGGGDGIDTYRNQNLGNIKGQYQMLNANFCRVQTLSMIQHLVIC